MTCNIVISTGAGISAESGVRTYRDRGGLWQKYDPDVVSHINGWRKNPQAVLDFKNELRRDFEAGNYQPNAAHHALTRLQREWRWGEVTIITQNIDGLHEAAGSTVLEMHGSGRKKMCEACGHVSAYDADIILADPCAKCGKTASTRPMVVWFGEMPMYLDIIEQKLDECGIFAAIGSSNHVMPASLFAGASGTKATYLFNIELPIVGADDYHHHRLGPATVEVPKWVDELLALEEEPPSQRLW